MTATCIPPQQCPIDLLATYYEWDLSFTYYPIELLATRFEWDHPTFLYCAVDGQLFYQVKLAVLSLIK